MIVVSALGINTAYETNFTINRPYGLGEYLFMHFNSSVEIFTKDGMVVGNKGDCIIHDPRFPNWHKGHNGGGFYTDWIHFHGKGIHRIIKRSGLSVNTLFRPKSTIFIPGLLREIYSEISHRGKCHEEAQDSLLKLLLLKVGRSLRQAAITAMSISENKHFETFQDIRGRVREQLQKPWTVESMAKISYLSPNRFTILYKNFFGISPMEDLIKARLIFAKYLLTNRSITIGEVAAHSGFRDIHHFSRIFKQRVGCSPKQYYKSHTHNTREKYP